MFEDETIQSPFRGILSACRGQGIRGWIHAFNETLVIRPKLLLTDTRYRGKHNIDDDHIIYKYADLNRSDYAYDYGHHQQETDEFLAGDIIMEPINQVQFVPI